MKTKMIQKPGKNIQPESRAEKRSPKQFLMRHKEDWDKFENALRVNGFPEKKMEKLKKEDCVFTVRHTRKDEHLYHSRSLSEELAPLYAKDIVKGAIACSSKRKEVKSILDALKSLGVKINKKISPFLISKPYLANLSVIPVSLSTVFIAVAAFRACGSIFPDIVETTGFLTAYMATIYVSLMASGPLTSWGIDKLTNTHMKRLMDSIQGKDNS